MKAKFSEAKNYSAAIIGSHGYRATYGGWDQLVNHLVDQSSRSGKSFIVYNSRTTKRVNPPGDSRVVNFGIDAHGISGMFFDVLSILHAIAYTDTLILLGAQGLPVALLLRRCLPFRKIKIIVNAGGIEWDRPKFNKLERAYLRFVFRLSYRYADYFILDNEHYTRWLPQDFQIELGKRIRIIPYGGEIDLTGSLVDVKNDRDVPFDTYYLSVSRALEDNCLDQLCSVIERLSSINLVLISNFSMTEYGRTIFQKYCRVANIKLINSFYVKSELDALRRGCMAYIHTHTLCGSAPSLIEMIVCGRPIISVDVPQNRYTLEGEAIFFRDFDELCALLASGAIPMEPSEALRSKYSWRSISDTIYALL